MKKDFSQLKKDLNEFGIELTAEMEEQFLLYYNMLIEWNSFMNLTAITDFDEVLKKHFTDSFSLIRKTLQMNILQGFALFVSGTLVEMAGVEPASKQGTQLLSTRLADRFVLLLEPGRRRPNPSPSLFVSHGARGVAPYYL